MSEMTEIIRKLIDKMKHSNPFQLVLKGGTALAYHHLDWHRESEDIDVDAPIGAREQIEDIEKWIDDLLDELKVEGVIRSYEILKKAFSNTERYHMKIKLSTYKDYQTKIDIDFKEIGSNIEYEGELGFYSSESMLVTKLNTFRNRVTLKDIYDISHLLKVVDHTKYSNRSKLASLVDEVLSILQNEDLGRIYDSAFTNVDLRFKTLKRKNVPGFQKRCIRDLQIFRNQLLK